MAAYQASLHKQDVPTLNDLARWELFTGKPAADCATARQAVAAYGLKADDDSPSANYERVILQACLLLSKSADADYAAFQSALQTVRNKAAPGHPNIGKVQALAELVETASALRLLGAKAVITGIRPDLAQTLTSMGVDLGDIVTRGTLKSGIAYALRRSSSHLRRLPREREEEPQG